ncbi:MAG TPA: penicillin-binding protein activator [Pseudomonadales bacterium]
MLKQFQPLCLLFTCLLLVLSACTSPPSTPTHDAAESDSGIHDAFALQIDELLSRLDTDNAESLLANLQLLENQAISSDHHGLLAYARARIYLASDDIDSAYLALNNSNIRQHQMMASLPVQVKMGLVNAELLARRQQNLAAARQRIYLAPLLDDETAYQDNHDAIWALLSQVDSRSIDSHQYQQEQVLFQWLQLNHIIQSSGLPLQQQVAAIDKWQQQNPWHPAARRPPAAVELLRNGALAAPTKIAVILPLDGKFRKHGIAIRDGLMQAYYRSGYRPLINFYAFDELPGFIDVYQEAVYDGAELVIGPLFKEQLQELYQYPQLPVPTIALNRLDEPAPAEAAPAGLYTFSLSPDDEIDSVVSLASAEQRQRAIILRQSDDWARRASDIFRDQWQAAGHRILTEGSFDAAREQSAVVQAALNINKSKQRHRQLQWLTGLSLEFEPRRRQDVDMIMLLARTEAAASIRPLLAFHYAGDIPIYATSSIYRGYADRKTNNDLNGIRFSDMPVLIREPDTISDDYRQSPLIRFYAFGMDAFALSERIRLMGELPALQIHGATGRLHVASQAVVRKTDYGLFRAGLVQALPTPDAEPPVTP